MAKTRAGRDLTDTHRQQQVVLRASIEQAATALDELMDLDDVAGSFPVWFAGRSVLANAGIETSRRLATAYVGEYGRAEAGVELVAGHPRVDQQRVAYEAHVDAVVMTKARIAAGMSPEEAWRIQSVITYGKLGQMVLDAGRQTITTSSFKYSGRRGRWRRVSDGAPCAFCAMLVGRGPVYSDQTVHFRAHNHCGCTAELVLHEWEPTEEEALYRASYMQAALDAEEEFGRSWARTAAGENNILYRMRRNNPGLFNDGVFAKDSQFRSPAWVKAREANQRKREAIRLARVTGRDGGGGKPPKIAHAGPSGASDDAILVQALQTSKSAQRVRAVPTKPRRNFDPPSLSSIESARIAPEEDPWKFFDKDSAAVAAELEKRLGIRLRSIATADKVRGRDRKSPDAFVAGSELTLELKRQKGRSLASFGRNISESRKQSALLAYLTNGTGDDSALVESVKDYVRRYGHGHHIVIGMGPSGKVVYWINE